MNTVDDITGRDKLSDAELICILDTKIDAFGRMARYHRSKSIDCVLKALAAMEVSASAFLYLVLVEALGVDGAGLAFIFVLFAWIAGEYRWIRHRH